MPKRRSARLVPRIERKVVATPPDLTPRDFGRIGALPVVVEAARFIEVAGAMNRSPLTMSPKRYWPWREGIAEPR